MKIKLKNLINFIILGLILFGIADYFYSTEIINLGPLTKTSTVFIKKGTSLKEIAVQLKNEGFINNPKVFLLTTKLMRKENKLQAGEIRIPAYASVLEIIKLLSNAKSVQYRFTIPEGLTSYQILQMIEKEENLLGDIIIDVKEGELLPETYLYSKGDTKNRIIERMQEAMRVTLNDLWEKRSSNIPYKTKEEALIMASIIEKETSVSSEYDIIAGVFVNRLNKRMRLQTDPTIIYALSEGKGSLGRKLLRKDLSINHPYNTYKNYGLPPGPICNPGLKALKASLNPSKTKYLYFVADGSGGHAFAKTLVEHNKNVAEWKKFRKQRRLINKQKARSMQEKPDSIINKQENLEEDYIDNDENESEIDSNSIIEIKS